jgi:hypothetical protein
MIRLTGVVLALMAFWSPSRALACDCGIPPVDIAIRQADVILSGPVTRIETTEIAGVLRVTVYVREVLKGHADRIFAIYSRPFGGPCLGFDFKVGREYVVFALTNASPHGSFHMPEAPATGQVVHLCGGTADLQNPLGPGNRRLQEVRRRLKPQQ